VSGIKKIFFCGWYDANLSEKGVKEAHAGGQALKEAGFQFDIAHTSLLKRAHQTLAAVLEEIGQTPEIQKNLAIE